MYEEASPEERRRIELELTMEAIREGDQEALEQQRMDDERQLQEERDFYHHKY
jgi:hypothetical protein